MTRRCDGGLWSGVTYAYNLPMDTTTTTARRLFHLRREVHAAVAGAENALCGVRLIAAVPLDEDPTGIASVTCARCADHRFETTPGLWNLVQAVGEDITEVGGLPESTAGFDTDEADNDQATEDRQAAGEAAAHAATFGTEVEAPARVTPIVRTPATMTDDQVREVRGVAEAFLASWAAHTLVGRDQDLYPRHNRWTGRAVHYGIPLPGRGFAAHAEAAARYLMGTDRTR